MTYQYIAAATIKALFIKRTLGIRVAAYLRNLGFAPDAAISLLAKKGK